jgi:selenide, water dikinase
VKRLLLIGGGHSHVEVVRRFGMAAPAGVEVILVSPEPHMPYSGMLPGYIAGHYSLGDIHIDVAALCRQAGIRYVPAEAARLDLARRTVDCGTGGEMEFDVLSLNLGSTPDASVPGSLAHAIPVKPVPRLLWGWEHILAAARREPQSVVVVGGGAGGVELALAMEYRLRTECPPGTTLAVVTDGATILPGHPRAAHSAFVKFLARRAIALHIEARVNAVEAGGLRLESGARIAARWIIWAISASAPPWLAASGLATDARGFVSVDDTLRSTSHSCVFGSGDCVQFAHRSLSKSGLYAVRQGPVLATNLRNAVGGAPLQRYFPQRRSLALISTGGRHAVATWGSIALGGRWAWRWKDWIDRRFMATYRVAARAC